MPSDVLKCSVMCGTAGVYMSSDRGVTSDVMTSSTISPNGPNRRCGCASHECSAMCVILLAKQRPTGA